MVATDRGEKTCRICLDTADPETMICPCKCRGTSSFVHRACLDRWRTTASNPEAARRCFECHALYQYQDGSDPNAPVSCYVYGLKRFATKALPVCTSLLTWLVAATTSFITYGDSEAFLNTYDALFRIYTPCLFGVSFAVTVLLALPACCQPYGRRFFHTLFNRYLGVLTNMYFFMFVAVLVNLFIGVFVQLMLIRSVTKLYALIAESLERPTSASPVVDLEASEAPLLSAV